MIKLKLNKLILLGIGIYLILFFSVATAANNGNSNKNTYDEIFVDKLTANNNTEIEINSSLIWTNNVYTYFSSAKKDYSSYTSGNLKTHVENSNSYTEINQHPNRINFVSSLDGTNNMFQIEKRGFWNYYYDSNDNYNYLGLDSNYYYLEVGDNNKWLNFVMEPDNFYFFADNWADAHTFGMDINGIYTDKNVTLNGENTAIDLKYYSNSIKLYSPNNTCYKLTVDDNGTLSTNPC